MLAVPLLALWLATASSETPQPELPRLPLEQYPPELRARVSEALARAEGEPRSAGAAGALGMLLHAYDQLESAEACYRRAWRLAPSAFEWAYLEGLVAEALGQRETAAAALGDALRVQPASLPARLKLAEVRLAQGDPAGGEELYRAILREDPATPQAHYGLGRVEDLRGRRAAAAEHYLEAMRLFEGFGAAQYALALAYRDLGREEDARQHLALYQKHWLDAPPLDDPVLERVRQLKGGALQHLAEGVRLGKAGDTLASIREHEKALEEDPKLAQAHANLISLYGRLGQWDKAEQHYRRRHRPEPRPGRRPLRLRRGAQPAGPAPRGGAAAFRKALEINPYHAGAHNNLGSLLLAEGRLDEAAGHFQASLENDPDNRLARFNLGRVLVAQGRLAEAIAELQRIVTPEDEETPRYLYALGAAYVRAGDREKGLRTAEEAKRKAEALGQADARGQHREGPAAALA